MQTAPMTNSRAIPFLLLLLWACTDERRDRSLSTVVEPPTFTMPPEPDPPIDVPPSEQNSDRIDPVRSTSTPSSAPIVAELEGCSEFTRVKDGITTITLYIPKRALEANNEAIRSEVTSAYQMAEQGASRSISCDFEHGTSTEHIHLPDTLPVIVEIFERCSAAGPHTTQRYAVWRTSTEALGVELR